MVSIGQHEIRANQWVCVCVFADILQARTQEVIHFFTIFFRFFVDRAFG
jgi:hypothetical protein